MSRRNVYWPTPPIGEATARFMMPVGLPNVTGAGIDILAERSIEPAELYQRYPSDQQSAGVEPEPVQLPQLPVLSVATLLTLTGRFIVPPTTIVEGAKSGPRAGSKAILYAATM